MLEKIEEQISQFAKRLEQSAANHNYLLGAKSALESLYATMKADAPAAEAVVAVVDPALAPAVDSAVNTVESVAAAVE